MKKLGTISLFLIFSMTCLFVVQSSSGHGMAIPTPTKGTTIEWTVKETNVNFSWWSNSFTFIENTTISSPGKIQFELIDKYPNNQFGSNITGDVWFGNFSIWTLKAGENNISKNWSVTNVSTTEVGSNLALSVYAWNSTTYKTYISWAPGLVVDVNWTLAKEILLGPGLKENVSVKEADGRFMVWFNDGSMQETYLEYDKATGVLLRADTKVGAFHAKIEWSGYEPIKSIPGYPLITFSIVVMVTFALLIIPIRKRLTVRN
ncbi:MAG: hypothetical protein ACTSVI_11045 [Promethearchaeota archaeon]